MDNKLNGIFRLKFRRKGQVGGNLLSSNILCFAGNPLFKLLAFCDRFSGQDKNVSGIVGVRCISFAFNNIRYRKGILFIGRPDRYVFRNRDMIIKFFFAVLSIVDPLADITAFGRNFRNIIQSVGGINIYSPYCKDFAQFFALIKCYGVDNFVIVRNDCHIAGRNIRFIDATYRCPDRALSAL